MAGIAVDVYRVHVQPVRSIKQADVAGRCHGGQLHAIDFQLGSIPDPSAGNEFDGLADDIGICICRARFLNASSHSIQQHIRPRCTGCNKPHKDVSDGSRQCDVICFRRVGGSHIRRCDGSTSRNSDGAVGSIDVQKSDRIGLLNEQAASPGHRCIESPDAGVDITDTS